MKLPPRVEVLWYDADASGVWADKSDIEEWATTPHVCLSRGWLAHQDETCIMVGNSYDTMTGKFGGIIKIPMSFVLKVKGGSKK